jgi:UDP-N-acetylmuramyl pentapeptide phosphotransferase/UDP-N-acetylglucosamine-1-phosphate transferase
MDSLLLLLLIPQIAISYGVTWAIRTWAVRFKMMDIPNERSSHTSVTPRGGGIAIVLTVILSVIALAVVTGVINTPEILAYLVGGTLIAIVGILDDMQSLSASRRFAMQAFVALIIVAILGHPTTIQIPILGILPVGNFGIIIVMLWIVGFINAYNFMDGIDGMAAGTGTVIALGWLSLFGISFDPNVVIIVLTIALMGGCIGFLGQNWQPAKIFMGDAGSTFLGFTFAVLPLMLKETQVQSLTASALVMWPFLFDPVFTFVRRLLAGKNVFKAHREHIYQKLVIAGLPHAVVAGLYMSMSVMGIVFASAYLEGSRIVLIAPLMLAGCLVYLSHLLTSQYQLTRKESAVTE